MYIYIYTLTYTHLYIHLHARGVMVTAAGNGHGETSSHLGRNDCISHSTNTLGKGMNPIIFLPASSKY